MKVGSDTFWQPIFQMILQNQQSSPIIGAFGCFAKHFSLVKMCQNLTFKVTFLCLIFFSIGIIGLINIFCYTGIWNVWGGWFLAGNQDNHQNSISSLISQNLWLIFMGMKHLFFFSFEKKNQDGQLKKTEIFTTANSQNIFTKFSVIGPWVSRIDWC